jgi:hypothetical protein
LPARVPKTVKKVTMTRRTRARHDSGNEAGLHSPTTLHFALSLPRISFASLASVVYVGLDLTVRYLCYETCWPVLERFGYFCLFLNTSSAICLQTKCTSRHRPGPRLTWSDTQYRNAPFFLLDTPIFLQCFHNAQLRHVSQLLRMNNSNGWHLRGL